MDDSNRDDRTSESVHATPSLHPTVSDPEPTVLTGAGATVSSSAAAQQPVAARRLPEKIGEYRILRMLGEGGMGVVYEAEQQSPRRRVAVKIMRQGHFVDDHHARMFHREAETLGRLKHPGIAAIYESGHTEDGHDFFAMELVQGQTLDLWLAKRPTPMSPPELDLRLRLFRTICDAVNYAHLRGVIHRDLKPSNIIVTDDAGSHVESAAASLPAVKILDFGLARIMDADVQGGSMLTEVGMIKGTLQYMSPEQARAEADAIDLRTDVYALGMILYEMLTLRRPYDLARSTLAEAVRVVCEAPPTPLAQAWSGTKKPDPDLDTIVGRALEKEPERRYASAAALSEDVERYLTLQPIVARPPSTAYRARKYVQRHRVGVGIAAGVALTLVAFAATMTVQAGRIARERDHASREAEVAKRVSAFLTGLFKISDPSEARGKSITVRDLLDKGANDIKTLADQPEVQARLMITMGNVYDSLGLYSQAESLLAPALAIQRRTLGPEHSDTLETAAELAWEYCCEARYESAEKLLRETIEISGRTLGPEHRITLNARTRLASVLTGERHFAEAAALDKELIAISRRLYGADDARTLNLLSNLGALYGDDGQALDAVRVDEEALAISRRLRGNEHPTTLRIMTNLSDVYKSAGRLDEAERMCRETIEIQRRVLGPEHPMTAGATYNLACILIKRGRNDEALGLIRQAFDHGMRDADARLMPQDPDLAPLHGDPRYEALMAESQRRVAKNLTPPK
ncbi:MAG: tetratricopeptide repeat protein [Thermoanaerobaculales bacterium]